MSVVTLPRSFFTLSMARETMPRRVQHKECGFLGDDALLEGLDAGMVDCASRGVARLDDFV